MAAKLVPDYIFKQLLEDLEEEGQPRERINLLNNDRQSKRANQQVPLIVDDDTRSLLLERNRPDYDLYNALVTCPGVLNFHQQNSRTSYV